MASRLRPVLPIGQRWKAAARASGGERDRDSAGSSSPYAPCTSGLLAPARSAAAAVAAMAQ